MLDREYNNVKLALTIKLGAELSRLNNNALSKRDNVLTIGQIEMFMKQLKNNYISYEQLCYLYNILYNSDRNISSIVYDDKNKTIILVTFAQKKDLVTHFSTVPTITTRMIEKTDSCGEIKDTVINLYRYKSKTEGEKIIYYSLKEGIFLLSLKTKSIVASNNQVDYALKDLIASKDYKTIEHRSEKNPSCIEILDVDGNTYEVQEDFDSENIIDHSSQTRSVMKELIDLSKISPETKKEYINANDNINNILFNEKNNENNFLNKNKTKDDPNIEEFYRNITKRTL